MPSYQNNRNFLEKIDALPTKGPEWTCDIVTAAGDKFDDEGNLMSEELELWKRNPVECVQELLGNPSFKEHLAYAPEHVYKDAGGKTRIFDEMWTADWWWDTQVSF
jgi:Plavaka transposase